MKTTDQSIKKLAGLISMGMDTMRRTICKGEFPAMRAKIELRFDLHKVRIQM